MMSTTAVKKKLREENGRKILLPSAKEAGRETSPGGVGQAQGGEPERQRTSWPVQGSSPEVRPAEVIIKGKGLLGLAKGRE